MRYLIISLLFLPFISSAQVDTILTRNDGSQLYSAMTVNGLKSLSLRNPPTSFNRENFPVGLVLANSRPTFYIWRNTCPSQSEDSVYMHIGENGCWQRATNNYLTASWCLERVGDNFQIDIQCVLDSIKYLMPALNDLPSNADRLHWTQVYNSWIVDSPRIVRTNQSYANPSWITSLDIAKVPNASTTSYVDAGVAALKTYSDNSYQIKGNYRTTPQTLTLSGRTLGITDGNSVTIPKDTQTISIAGSVVTVSNGGGSVTLPTATTYTGTAPIVVTGSVIGYSGLRPIAMPNISVSETAVLALSAGVRNVVVACTGIIAGERVLVSPNSTLAGYIIYGGIATANNQITVQLTAPLLALNASYSIPCTITVFR